MIQAIVYVAVYLLLAGLIWWSAFEIIRAVPPSARIRTAAHVAAFAVLVFILFLMPLGQFRLPM